MVGEMRDPETAGITIQSALTGHMVFSTLHTNDAAGGVTRLLDMGVEPYLVAATLEGILAQRLVRRVCGECAEPYQPSEEAIGRLDMGTGDTSGFRRGGGCDTCSGTGYQGRTGVYELMEISDRVRQLIVGGEPQDEIRRVARDEGMAPLQLDGWQKAANGITTLEEVLRVTRDEVAP
jgi:type II secretory ATPase GspE/PulE/Tfp pilus assembly ATPase PilB-like protein